MGQTQETGCEPGQMKLKVKAQRTIQRLGFKHATIPKEKKRPFKTVFVF